MTSGGTSIQVLSRMGNYVVTVQNGALHTLGQILHSLSLTGRVAVVTDECVWAYWGSSLKTALLAANISFETFSVKPGETSKSLSVAEKMYDFLIRHHFSRKDCLLAFGGGVVGDLGGFVASTFHRGMPLVQIPTTLLAMVDASIGGKVAINHPLGKNLIGSFYSPRAVVADPQVLSTLSVRQRFEGLAEMLKAALVADASLYGTLEKELKASPQSIFHAMQVKATIVSRDETETHERSLLNFGHTFGHALETLVTPGEMTHGEAVVVGMKLATRLSAHSGRLAPQTADRIQATLSQFPVPKLSSPLSWQSIAEQLSRDKKGLNGSPRWVLLEDIGKGSWGHDMPWDVLQMHVVNCLEELSG